MVLNGHDEDDVGLNVLGCRADILGTIMSTETIRLIGDGEKRGGGDMEVAKRGRL